VAAYLNDIIIHSDSSEEHLSPIIAVLNRLKEAGLILKPHKCHLAMKECVYVGQVVGNGVVRPELDKVKTIEQFPVPTTKKQVHQFLDLARYNRLFIPEFAFIVVPLIELTRKKEPV